VIDCKCATTPKTTDNPLAICKRCRVRFLSAAAGPTPRRTWSARFHVFVTKWLPWILSANTIVMTWLAGSLEPSAWAWGMWGQVGWTVWIIKTRTWGFLPMNLALWVVYMRNHLSWTLP
jgi:hypothetical protein